MGRKKKPKASSRTPIHRPMGMQLLRVVWMSTALGIVLEMILLAVMTLAHRVDSPWFFVADLAQKVSWSLLVCVAVAMGVTLSHALQPLAAGVVGLVASPMAFAVARGVHKAAASSLQIPLPAGPSVAPNLWVIAMIKGIEFGLLGAFLAWTATKPWAGFKTYAASGLMAGMSFGAVLVSYVYSASEPQPATAAIAAQALNELVYPVGCALVLYASGVLGKQIADGRILAPDRVS